MEQPYPLQAAAPSSHAPASSCGSGSRYAIVKLGGVRQMVEEGHAYTCPKRYLQVCPLSQQQLESNSMKIGDCLLLCNGGRWTPCWRNDGWLRHTLRVIQKQLLHAASAQVLFLERPSLGGQLYVGVAAHGC